MVDRQYIYNIKNKGSMNFFSHPDSVCLSYVEHFKFSMYLSIEFAKASVAAFIHAIYPDVLITYSSDTVSKLSQDMSKIGCRKD